MRMSKQQCEDKLYYSVLKTGKRWPSLIIALIGRIPCLFGCNCPLLWVLLHSYPCTYYNNFLSLRLKNIYLCKIFIVTLEQVNWDQSSSNIKSVSQETHIQLRRSKLSCIPHHKIHGAQYAIRPFYIGTWHDK